MRASTAVSSLDSESTQRATQLHTFCTHHRTTLDEISVFIEVSVKRLSQYAGWTARMKGMFAMFSRETSRSILSIAEDLSRDSTELPLGPETKRLSRLLGRSCLFWTASALCVEKFEGLFFFIQEGVAWVCRPTPA